MEDPVLSTESGDQDERIRARRLRIEKRNLSKNEEGNKKKSNNPQEENTTHRKQQVANSLVKLDKNKADTIENVTSIRVEADHTESNRRIVEEDKRQRRLQSLQSEALVSGKKNAAVEMRWAELMEYNMPLELHTEVQKQRNACLDIVSSKDRVIEEFQRELKIKDEEYVKALKRQGDDIETLLSRMSSQYKELQEQYEAELQSIEEAFLQERKEMIDANRSETDALFEKRRVMEMNFMEARQEREAKFQQELSDLRTKDAEDYNQLKIKLETDIQVLEQQLEEMRATYQLNTEKLEYNYRVLTERDMENSATLAQQKRKLARLKDTLSNLTSKYQSTDTTFKQENMDLTEEYRRITKQYKDLQNKFRHFEIADNKKYREIWSMHKDEVMDQVNQLLAADKIIQEQQLGHMWAPPAPEILQCRSASFLGEDKASKEEGAASPTIKQQQQQDSANVEESDADEIPQSKVANAKVKYMLELLSSEASFLIDPKIKLELEQMDKREAAVLRADSILKSLNVESKSDIKMLLGFFFNKADDDEDDAFAFEQAADRESQLQSLGLKVAPDDVVKVIREFVYQRNHDGERESKTETSADITESANVPGTGGVTGGAVAGLSKRKKREHQRDEEQRASDARRERDRQEEIDYWNRLAAIVPDRTIRVWEALEQAMQKYNANLVERAASIAEVDSLERQNEELKNLLNEYLGSQTVQDLLVPPMETTAPEPFPRNNNKLYR